MDELLYGIDSGRRNSRPVCLGSLRALEFVLIGSHDVSSIGDESRLKENSRGVMISSLSDLVASPLEVVLCVLFNV